MKRNFEIKGIDHIGIAPKEDSKLSHLFEKILGFSAKEEEIVEIQKVKVQKFHISDQSLTQPALELLYPTTKESVINKFREKKRLWNSSYSL